MPAFLLANSLHCWGALSRKRLLRPISMCREGSLLWKEAASLVTTMRLGSWELNLRQASRELPSGLRHASNGK